MMNNDSENDDESLVSYDSNYSNDIGSDGDSTELSMGGSQKRDEVKLAQTESKFVLCSKFMAYLVLFLSAVAAGVAAYYFTRDQESSAFAHEVSPPPLEDCVAGQVHGAQGVSLFKLCVTLLSVPPVDSLVYSLFISSLTSLLVILHRPRKPWPFAEFLPLVPWPLP